MDVTSRQDSNNANKSVPDDRPPLEIPLAYFPGVGSERAALLHRLGIHRPIDLLFFFPRSYQSVAPFRTSKTLETDVRASVVGKIEAIDFRGYEDGRSSLGALIDTGDGYVRLIWYNQPFRKDKLARGMRLVATGIPKPTGISWEMRHPDIQMLDATSEPPAGKPIPVYSLTEGLQQRHLQKMIDSVLSKLSSSIPEVLPESFRVEQDLMDVQQALRQIHQPESLELAMKARRRFIFQELLLYQLALAMRRYELRHSRPSPVLKSSALIDARILHRFPFELTADQRRVIDEVAKDMAESTSMNRLVQGDVGSGKTVIALYAMLLSVANSHQAVLMAPTEVLARQHAGRLQASLKGSKVEVELLTGSMAQRDRSDLLERIALGTVDIVVGTQALLSDRVQFHRLGLVVIDEQHKFGVQQRAALRGSETQPHYLVLSATPIPRTLTMSVLGDLDVSILREKPAGRAVVHTYLGHKEQEKSWWEFVAKQLRQGRQAYVIAARVDQERVDQENEEDLQGAIQIFDYLSKGVLSEFRIGLLHGRMDGQAKQEALDSFESGEVQILVSTTVVEVGIDVPNATVMTILDANRMGLAQLHQLRGRISRGIHPGYLCVFATGGASPADNARLQALSSTNDGFQLAELDLQMRGPGDLLGTRQHGLPPFRIADLVRDEEILLEVRDVAQRIIDADPKLTSEDWHRVQKQVLSRHGGMLELGDVA